METSRRPTTTQARRSCQTCASAKVKCMQADPNSSSKCDRCRRLNKECALQPSAERKPRTRKKTTRVAQLEQKLDGLVSLLTAKESAQNNPYQSPESLARPSSLSSPTALGSHAPDDATASSPPDAGPMHDPTYCFRIISPAAAQEYLEVFQERMSSYFPFVIIPSELTAEKLRTEKPALFGAVVVAASFQDIKQQTVYGESLLRHFLEELLMKGEKTLELLQALLVYISWYQFIFHIKKRMTHLISLAAALVTDLGLARANPHNERLTLTMDDTKGAFGCATTVGIRTLEERRAYAGVFYIASCVSTCYRELHTMKISTYLEECCAALENAAEYPTDTYLVQITRLQGMVERISHTFQYGFRSNSPRLKYKVPIYMYVSPFEREFDAYLENLPPELRQNSVILMHFFNAKGYLYEIALYEPIQQTWYGQQSFRRMEFLFACLQTIKSFYDVLETIPTAIYYYMPLVNWTQVTHCIVNLSKLCFLDAEDWNMTHVREVLDFSKVLEITASKFEEVRLHRSIPPAANDYESDLFSRFARRMRLIKVKYDKRIAAEARTGSGEPANTTGMPPEQPQSNDPEGAVEMFANLDDDEFWHELMGDWYIPPMSGLQPESMMLLPEFVPQPASTSASTELLASESRKSYVHSTCSAAVN